MLGAKVIPRCILPPHPNILDAVILEQEPDMESCYHHVCVFYFFSGPDQEGARAGS